VQREGTSWRQFIGANFEPFVIYNFSMRRQKSLPSCRKLQELEFYLLRVVFTDLGFGVELTLPALAIAIYVKK
jgi:hypothetical protein